MSVCRCNRVATKRAAALAIEDLTIKEKRTVYRKRYEENHPGKLNTLKCEWYTRNRERVTSKKKKQYAEQKAGGLTYYQRNADRIKARQRELYAEKKRARTQG
jgi:hypothetical protein